MTYRNNLPQLGSDLFLTDSGLETILVFDDGIDLPAFASFPLLTTVEGTSRLRRYYDAHAAVARRHRVGAVLDTPTWRASADWGARLGFGAEALDEVNRRAVAVVEATRRRFDAPETPIVVNGCIGPRGDGYIAGEQMTASEAEAYHGPQVRTFAAATADLVSGVTMTSVEEAIGVTRAARGADIPAVISFTVETDGRLPSGHRLGEAIDAVDAASDAYPAYYMINCAHPTHFAAALDVEERWVERLRGIRSNGSRLSHAELDRVETLDSEDPAVLADEFVALRRSHPQLTVLGGCCGTNHAHIEAIGAACTRQSAPIRA